MQIKSIVALRTSALYVQIDFFNDVRMADMGSPKDILARMRVAAQACASRPAWSRGIRHRFLISGECQY